MPIKSIVLAISISLMAVLSACDSTRHASTDSGAAGGVSFRLSSADSTVVAGTVDSIQIEAISRIYGTVKAQAPFGQTVTIPDLQSGTWTLQATLFRKDGAISWAGKCTVEVKPGEVTSAKIILHKAHGSIRVEVVLDTVEVIDSRFVSYKFDFKPVLPSYDTYSLDSAGNAVHVHVSYSSGDSATTEKAKLDAVTLGMIRGLLSSEAARNPAPNHDIPEGRRFGGATIQRTTSYANGLLVTNSINFVIQDPSSDWNSLNPVDSLLQKLFIK